MTSSKIGMWKGLLFVSRRYAKGVAFRSKIVYMNMCIGCMKGRSQSYKTSLSTPGVSYCGLTFLPLFTILHILGSCHML